MSKADKQKLRKIMKNYRINASLISELHNWGLDVIKTKNHIRVVRRDGVGGVVIIASTPSDWRAGPNAASQLIRLLAS